MPKKIEPAVFQIEFKKGKADRNRLPLAHVLATLQELDLMIREVGRKVQRDSGIENPDGDFGIELLAGSTGIAFSKGSVRASAAITRDVENGIQTVGRVIGTTAGIEKKQVASVDEYGAPVVRRFAKIGEMQELDHTELGLKLAQKGTVTDKAVLSGRGFDALRALSAADFSIESLTVYGKLKRLTDFSKDEDRMLLWGELVEDNGDVWRVRFLNANLKKVRDLFTKQVVISGDASYFKTKHPRLDARTVSEDRERHYIAGFNRFRKDYRRIFGDRDPEEILKEIRG